MSFGLTWLVLSMAFSMYRMGRGLRTTGVLEPDTESNIISTFLHESYKHFTPFLLILSTVWARV
jgi:hypothetical protein